jgi:hypothetical protein
MQPESHASEQKSNLPLTKTNKQTESEGGGDKTEHMFVEMQRHVSFLASSRGEQ